MLSPAGDSAVISSHFIPEVVSQKDVGLPERILPANFNTSPEVE